MVDAIDLLRQLLVGLPPEVPVWFSGLAPIGTVDVFKEMIVTAGQLRDVLGPPVEPDPNIPPVITINKRVQVTATAGLNIRAEPDVNSAKLGSSLRYKTVVQVDAQRGDWYHLATGTKGWISAAYTKSA